MTKKNQPTENEPSAPTHKNRPLRLPMSFDHAVEGLVNIKRPQSATKKPAKKAAKKVAKNAIPAAAKKAATKKTAAPAPQVDDAANPSPYRGCTIRRAHRATTATGGGVPMTTHTYHTTAKTTARQASLNADSLQELKRKIDAFFAESH